MSRYIDVEQLISSGWHLEKTGEANVFITRMSLADVPTADVVKVKHGRWELNKCTCCNERVSWACDKAVRDLVNYCPNCGAKMDGR